MIERDCPVARPTGRATEVGRTMPVSSSVDWSNIEANMFRQKWLFQAAVIGWAASFAGIAAAEDTVVRQFSAGTSPTTVGIAAPVEDVELTGPQALTSDADGNLFVLDQINGRILRFDPKQPGGDPSVLKMPADVQPNDLVVRKSDILVWDGSIRTLKAANEQSTRGVDGTVVQ